MKLENQVLSIKQVQELIELGFDVEKYSSMYFVPNWITKYGIDEIQDYLLTIGELGDDYEGDCIPTMTIGDIMDILPKVIPILDRTKSSIFSVLKSYILQTDMKNYLRYKYADGNILLQVIESTYFINMLFDALKWCIQNKHITL